MKKNEKVLPDVVECSSRFEGVHEMSLLCMFFLLKRKQKKKNQIYIINFKY